MGDCPISSSAPRDGERPSRPVLRLDPEIDIPGAAALRISLLEGLSAGEAVVIDAAAVQRLGTAGVQVLLATARTANAAGTRFEIREPSEAVRTVFSDMGVDGDLKTWSSQA